MRFSEFSEAATIVTPVPSTIKRQQRVSKVMAQINASSQQQQPTEFDKVLAMRSHSAKQKQVDRMYAKQLKYQLAAAERVADFQT